MKKNILIYDDDAEILFLCKTILSKYDFNVETLSRCDDVLSDIIKYNPNFILMDLWIPEMGGEKAVKLIKENDATKHISVFLFSANADIQEICKKVNANGYIEKPFDLKAFVNVIESHVQ
ncbi:MAG: response regulator [Arcicella sp.]|nr:response regulator [Arcicella sp.]